MVRKMIDGAFVGLILLVLLVSLGRAVMRPRETVPNENRKADQMPEFTLASYLDGSFQDGMENALGDQILLSASMKRLYNIVRTESLLVMLRPFGASHPNQYVSFQGMRLFNGIHIVHIPAVLAYTQEELDRRAVDFNQVISEHKDVDFYLYYVEKDTDVNLETGEKPGLFEYLAGAVNLPKERMAKLEVNDFDTLSRWFYRTDSHWNYQGSYEGYLEVFRLLQLEGEPYEPTGTLQVGRFSGGKARTTGAVSWMEPIIIYQYDLPALNITRNGRENSTYGTWDLYTQEDTKANRNYGYVYGGDDGEIIFQGGDPRNGSILVLGESFDNAILKLLACHFQSLYSVDLRYYEHYMGADFDLTAYLQQHDIHKVLFIGNRDFYNGESFLLEG